MSETPSPDFLALQVRDLQRSADFYEGHLGLEREPGAPPGVIVFRSATIPFAIREPLPGTDLDAGPVGVGIAVSLRVSDAQLLHDNLEGAGVTILMNPFDTPFGRTFMFQDPDGYALAVHGALPS
ncbi:VOC family protein [Kribbella pittospori]|uniref:VOC family protein n=1 Tax=Kribbella pittospori TaxID=722689 RepID=A0A4R0KZ06_9ACTN|nr:VOC family protein [Kribbella pittospori]TCC65467.1 VOC family protein [Kribbella pittospori]